MKTAIYTRLSKDKTGLSENCAIQLAECREYVADQDWLEVLALEENDVSASKFSKKPRHKYAVLVEAVKQGEVEVILVTEMTRLYRIMEELLELIRLSETTELKRIQTTDGISYDLSTPEGAHAARAAVNNAILESAKLSKRLIRKKRVRASEGRYLGGYRAFGYEGAKYDDDGVLINRGRINIAVVPEEAEIYKSCVERVIQGERPSTVARDLNARNIPSPAGKQWTVGNMKRILMKKRYVIFDDNDSEQRGTLEHHGQEYRAAWPGLITRTQYELMMSRFVQQAQAWPHGMVQGRRFLLTGFLVCGNCKAAMSGSRRDAAHGNVRRYRCRSHNNHYERIGCGKVFRAADPLEAFVTDEVLARFNIPEVEAALTQQDEADPKLNELITKLANLQQRRKQLVSEYGQGVHELRDYKLMLHASDTAIEGVQHEINQRHSNSIARGLPAHDRLRETWNSASLDWQHSVMQLVVDKIIILPSEPGIVMYKDRWRFDPKLVRIEWKQTIGEDLAAELSVLMRSRFALAA